MQRNEELHRRINTLRKIRNSACQTRVEQDVKIERLQRKIDSLTNELDDQKAKCARLLNGRDEFLQI